MNMVLPTKQVFLTLYLMVLGMILGADLESLETAIGDAPPWAAMSSETIHREGPKLIEAMSKARALTGIEARRLVQNLMDNAGAYPADRIEEDAWSKVCILIRLFTNVPTEPVVLRNGIAQWGGGKLDGSSNVFWPLEFQGEEIVLKGVFSGYFGPPYDGVKEFDILYRLMESD